jgi:hypothetical protein|tara:strand:+ start:345 stop:461 length:117 start_codon:yes stop_codon:yes gene_type:complete
MEELGYKLYDDYDLLNAVGVNPVKRCCSYALSIFSVKL